MPMSVLCSRPNRFGTRGWRGGPSSPWFFYASHLSDLSLRREQENTEMLLGDAKAMADSLLEKVVEQTR